MNNFYGRRFVKKQYNLSKEEIENMSVAELKRRILKLSSKPHLDSIEFITFGDNRSESVYDFYRSRATYTLMNELLKRENEKRGMSVEYNFKNILISIVVFLSILCTVGYANRSEKDKVEVDPSGIVIYSNGMEYSGFSSTDLNYIFGYNGEEVSNGILVDFIQDGFSGLGHMIFSGSEEKASFKKAYNDAEMLLKYYDVLTLDGVCTNNFYMKDMSLNDWKSLGFYVDSNIQSLCKVYTLGQVVEKYGEEVSDLFYKSIYCFDNEKHEYLNSKEDLIRIAGFNTQEELDNFMMEVINTLKGNVFYFSNPRASDFYVELDKGMVLTKTF